MTSTIFLSIIKKKLTIFFSKINFTKILKSPFFVLFCYFLLVIYKIQTIRATGPTIFGDEYVYIDNARNFFKLLSIKRAVYPPIYSILLIPAVNMSANWYRAIVLTNIFLSSLIVFPFWMFSKKNLSTVGQMVAMALLFFSPINFSYHNYALAENIFVVLFMLSVYLSIYSYNKNFLQRFIFGLVLGLSYLTKYLFLPSIFVFLFIWIIRSKPFSLKKIMNLITPVLLGLILTLIPWILYVTLKVNLPFAQALGFGISGIKATDQITINSLVLWFSSYSSYLIYSISMFLPVLVYFSLTDDKKCITKKQLTFLLSVVLLSIAYVLLATQHSWGANYNYPNPQYLIGRYLIQVVYLYPIVFVMIYEKLINKKHLSVKRFIAPLIISSLLIIFANLIFYKGAFFNLPPHFTKIIFNSPNTFSYSLEKLIVLIIVSIIPLVSLILKNKNNSKKIFVLSCLILITFQFKNTQKYINLIINNSKTYGIHGRYITAVLNSLFIDEKNRINFLSEESLPNLEHTLLSWGFDETKLNFINEKTNFIQNLPTILLSKNTYEFKIIGSYEYGDKSFYIYYADGQKDLSNFIQ